MKKQTDGRGQDVDVAELEHLVRVLLGELRQTSVPREIQVLAHKLQALIDQKALRSGPSDAN